MMMRNAVQPDLSQNTYQFAKLGGCGASKPPPYPPLLPYTFCRLSRAGPGPDRNSTGRSGAGPGLNPKP